MKYMFYTMLKEKINHMFHDLKKISQAKIFMIQLVIYRNCHIPNSNFKIKCQISMIQICWSKDK